MECSHFSWRTGALSPKGGRCAESFSTESQDDQNERFQGQWCRAQHLAEQLCVSHDSYPSWGALTLQLLDLRKSSGTKSSGPGEGSSTPTLLVYSPLWYPREQHLENQMLFWKKQWREHWLSQKEMLGRALPKNSPKPSVSATFNPEFPPEEWKQSGTLQAKRGGGTNIPWADFTFLIPF